MRKNDEALTSFGGSECDRYDEPVTRAVTLDDLTRAGIPTAICEWIVSIQRSHPDAPQVQRSRRLVDHARQGYDEERELAAAWTRIMHAAPRCTVDDNLIALFATFPDGPEVEPFAKVVGRRNVDIGEELRRYRAGAKYARALRKLLEFDNLKRIAADAHATGPQAVREYQSLAKRRADLTRGLADFGALLDGLDPSAKLVTRHYASAGIGIKNYRYQLAQLNRFLSSPEHSAIATIARVNCPSCPVLPNTLGQIWRRGDRSEQTK